MTLRVLFIYLFIYLVSFLTALSASQAVWPRIRNCIWNEATETCFNVCPSSYLNGLSKTFKISIGYSLRRARFYVGTSGTEVRGVTV